MQIKINLLLTIGIIFSLFLVSCELEEDPSENSGEPQSLTITGVKSSFSYSFHSASSTRGTRTHSWILPVQVKVRNGANSITSRGDTPLSAALGRNICCGSFEHL